MLVATIRDLRTTSQLLVDLARDWPLTGLHHCRRTRKQPDGVFGPHLHCIRFTPTRLTGFIVCALLDSGSMEILIRRWSFVPVFADESVAASGESLAASETARETAQERDPEVKN